MECVLVRPEREAEKEKMLLFDWLSDSKNSLIGWPLAQLVFRTVRLVSTISVILLVAVVIPKF